MVIPPAFAQNAIAVDGKQIANTTVDRWVQHVVAEGKQADSPRLRESARCDLIAREVLMQETEKQGFGNLQEVRAKISWA